MKYRLRKDISIIAPRGVTLYRIEYLKDMPGIKSGDFGGYLESEHNLNQDGDAHVFGDAQVSGDAQVFGNAQVSGDAWVFGKGQVSGNAQVFGNARVSGDARVSGAAQVFEDAWVFGKGQVSGDARVFGDARVSGAAQVFEDARVFGNAWVYGNAQVFGDAVVDAVGMCQVVTGIKHDVTLTKTHIAIGCEIHTIEYWRKNIGKIGRKHNYSEREIKGVASILRGLLKSR